MTLISKMQVQKENRLLTLHKREERGKRERTNDATGG